MRGTFFVGEALNVFERENQIIGVETPIPVVKRVYNILCKFTLSKLI